MKVKGQLIISGILFTLHNVEEVTGFIYFNPFDKLTGYFPHLPPFQLAVPVAIITLLAWTVISIAFNSRSSVFVRDALTTFGAMFLLNAFIPHILGALILRSYFPALLTSVFIYIPYSIWLLGKMKKLYSSPAKFYKTAFCGLLIVIMITMVIQTVNCFLV